MENTAEISSGLYLHHSIIGAFLLGAGGLFAAFAPELKERTKFVVGIMIAGIGIVLIWDDLLQHIEKQCPFNTIIRFEPCPTVVKKSENVVKGVPSNSIILKSNASLVERPQNVVKSHSNPLKPNA